MPPRGYTSSSKGQQRPEVWKTGPDPVRHKRYRRYALAKCQAQHFHKDKQGNEYEAQAWAVTWPEWESLILSDPEGDTKNVCRKDCSQPWRLDNMILLTRTEMLRRPKVGRRPYVPEGVRDYGKRQAAKERNLREFKQKKDTNESV